MQHGLTAIAGSLNLAVKVICTSGSTGGGGGGEIGCGGDAGCIGGDGGDIKTIDVLPGSTVGSPPY
eukprot:scaffold1526_cov33-Prasinocladus_malaysianus.AAC.1